MRRAADMRAQLQAQAVARIAAGIAARAVRAPAEALRTARRARRIFPRARFFAEAEALLAVRTQDPAAAALFAEIRAARRDGRLTGPSADTLIGAGRTEPGLALVLPARARPVHVPPALAARTLVYTAVFHDAPPPSPLFQAIPGLRFVCLSDRPLTVPGWDVIRTTPPHSDPLMAAAYCKILPHRVLAAAETGGAKAEWSLYVAPDRNVTGNLHTLLTRWFTDQDLALWRHPAGPDWRDLIEYHLLHGRADPERLIEESHVRTGLARDAGAWDTGILWRRHGSAAVEALMDAWWERQVETTPGAEDLALYATLHRAGTPETQVVPSVLPSALGPATDSLYFAQPPVVRERRPTGTARAETPAVLGQKPLGVSFLYAEQFATSASTFLRGAQLSAMVAARYPELYDVTYTSDAAGLRDQIVIVTKGAMKVLGPAALARLRARNVAVVASWDDDIPDPEKVAQVDAHLTLAIRQTLDLARLYPQVPAYFVTHHVNSQVPAVTPPHDRLRTGYFGTLENTVRPDSLAGMVDLVGINTATVESSWLGALPRYNCHWIVRQRKPIDGWKPFLKGFVAARCKSVVIVQRDDDDVGYYLGDDYPFYVSALTHAALEADMVEFTAAFGGPEWHMALEIMTQVAARSTEAQVCAEFKAMIDAITG